AWAGNTQGWSRLDEARACIFAGPPRSGRQEVRTMPVVFQEIAPNAFETYRLEPPWARNQKAGQSSVAPGHQVRTCANCGTRALFRMDPEGSWAVCEVCGRFA